MKPPVTCALLFSISIPKPTYRMHSRHSIGSVLKHYHRFSVFLVPRHCLAYHVRGDHFQASRIRVPSVVPVEADNVQMLGGMVLGRGLIYGRRDRSMRIEEASVIGNGTDGI